MKVRAVIKKVEKALGVKVNHPDGHGSYWAQYGDKIISWSANGSGDLDAHAGCYHIRREDDHSDLQTDYFAGYFVNNPTQMIHAVKPALPKFKVGALVRFRDNKRTQRGGLAGRLGIVTEANGGGMCSVNLAGRHPLPGLQVFHERDMQIAKPNL
jgi:hypothetical protein